MSLSVGFLKSHIKKWQKQLDGHTLSYRSAWPSRLFHHTPIQNAAQILRGGFLLSREQSAGVRAVDIAAPEIVNRRTDAHKSVRMYFRPRTPTQYRVEGIRKPEEYYQTRHAPVLVMLVFDLCTVLSQHGVRFSNGNMQSTYTDVGSTEEFFAGRIDWASVFHSSSTDERRIVARRCAEALIPSPHAIAHSLEWICCRSQAERAMLLHLLGPAAPQWTKKIIVSEDIQVFQKDYVYCEEVGINGQGIILRLHPRLDGRNVALRVMAWTDQDELVMNARFDDFRPVPLNAVRWRIMHKFTPGRYRIRVELEQSLAYDAPLLLDELPF